MRPARVAVLAQARGHKLGSFGPKLEPPEIGGYDFLKARATIEEVRNIPIVVMTNHAVDPTYAQNHAVLRKPVYEEELRKIVQMALAMRGWRN